MVLHAKVVKFPWVGGRARKVYVESWVLLVGFGEGAYYDLSFGVKAELPMCLVEGIAGTVVQRNTSPS